MYWANLLHFYQPPTQKKYWIDRISQEAYRPILRGLLELPEARLTLNAAAVLLELWQEYGHDDLIKMLQELVERGQVELTQSAKYHPLLPKLPRSEIERQLELNQRTLKNYFGTDYHPRGFFPPEMAYDRDLAQVISDLGYEWIIAEELSYQQQEGVVPYDRTFTVAGTKLKIYFREREASYKILSGQLGTPKLFLDEFGSRLDQDVYLLTAMDGETFGHHRPGMDKLLLQVLAIEKIRKVQVSELAERFPQTEVVKTFPSTWALMEKDVEKNIPFARWDDPRNQIHQLQWELTELAIGVVGRSDDPGEARKMLDRALHSDQYWWASARPWWSLEMIERGAKELRDTIDTVPDATAEVKQEARKLYYEIITTGFDWQREGIVEELSRQEDEEVRMRTDAGLPKLPKEEIEKMIATLQKEIEQVAANQEFERAIQLRDRVQELREYADER